MKMNYFREFDKNQNLEDEDINKKDHHFEN